MTHENAFKAVDGATVVMNNKGAFSVHALAVRQGHPERVYAQVGSKYIRLQADGFTSHAGYVWEDLFTEGNVVSQDRLKGPVWVTQ